MTTDNTEAPEPTEVAKAEEPAKEQAEETVSVDDATKGLRSELTKERKQRKQFENQLAQLLEEKEQRELAEKSELERAQDAVAKLESALETERLERAIQERKAAVQAVASKLGFADPEDASAFLDLKALDTDEVEAAVAELAAAKPHLLKKDSPTAVGADSSQVGVANADEDPQTIIGKTLAGIISERTKGKSFTFGD